MTLSEPELSGPRIQDLPTGERPRERLLQYGPGALSNAELIAILLRTGVRGESALSAAQRMLATCGGLRGIARSSLPELQSRKGLNVGKYCSLMAGLELGRRLALPIQEDRLVVNAPADVANLLMPEMALLSQEQLRVLLLSTKRHILGMHTVYVGTVNTALVRAAEVFRPAIRENAPTLVLVHNHPSGDPQPSRQDLELTKQLVEAGRLLNIELTDHLVLGQGRFISLRETTDIFPPWRPNDAARGVSAMELPIVSPPETEPISAPE